MDGYTRRVSLSILTFASQDAERERVLVLLREHGWSTTSFQVLEPAFRYYWDGDGACVAYVDTGRAWVAASAPIAPAGKVAAAAARFVQAARSRGRRACFFAVEACSLCERPFATIQIGEQPVWQPEQWAAIVRATRSLREQLRRARNKGVTIRLLSPAEVTPMGTAREAIERLMATWLRSRPMPPMGFLVDLQPFLFPAERRYLVAEQGGELIGFLAAVPIFARKGWFLEDLLRDPRAPNGTSELLIDAAMRLAQEQGSERVTLGLAPLAGGVPGWLRLLRDWTPGLYNFHGVRAFKAKFRPQQWEPVFLAYPSQQGHAVLAIFDSLAAFAGGSVPRFGLKTLLHSP